MRSRKNSAQQEAIGKASGQQECANCTTDRYPIKARGLCTRCYSLRLRIEKLEKGDLKPLGSLDAMRLRPDHPEVYLRFKVTVGSPLPTMGEGSGVRAVSPYTRASQSA